METAQNREILEEASVAPEVKEYRGLCSACKNAPTCTYPRDSDRPVLQCEEFEEWPIPPVNQRTHSTSSEILFRQETSSSRQAAPVRSGCYRPTSCLFDVGIQET